MTQPGPTASEIPQAVRVRLLGGFSVSVDSRTIRQDEWRSKKAATLVKLLALAPGHRMHREQAIDFLWPDSAKSKVSNNMRQVVYGARRVLHSGSGSRESYLGLKDEQLVLCPAGRPWVDVDAFEEMATTARRSRDPAAYRSAIELYAGDLLPEDRYEDWAEVRRNELGQLYLALIVELAGLYEESGEYDRGIEALRKVTAEEPTLEEAHASLMRLHSLSGRPEHALAQYERLRDALQRGIGSRPTETTRRLREEIAAGRLLPTSPADAAQQVPSEGAKHNLPAPMTSFVGREREIVDVKRALSMTRLLTLTGAGGTGKTRLTIEVARDLVGSYADGVWLVELAPLSESGLVAQEVANVLGVQERPGEPLTDTLIEALAARVMLLVIDNCEHIVEEAARLVDKLLASCPRLKVLATSREPLGVSGEVVWAVPPLSLPDDTTNGGTTAEELIRYEAVRLFVERARLRLLDFAVTKENAGAVAGVCRKLDGMPLAIELATATMGALAVEQVAERLEASLDVLKGNSRSAAPRQQTLRATLDWSHDLLSEDERMFFRRLSVFAGGWTLEAAEVVCSGGGVEEGDVLDLLGGLVDKSLVVTGTSTGGAMRYRMLEPLRQYAREKVEEAGEADEMQNRHAAYFLALAEEAELELEGPQQGLWMEQLDVEHDNLRAALSWVLEREDGELGLRFGGALWRFWYSWGYSSEGIGWMGRVLAGGGASVERLDALEGMGWLTQEQGDLERARATYEEMLELSRELDDGGNLATALNSLGTLAASTGDNEEAKRYLEENLSVLERLEEEGYQTTQKRYHASILLGFLALTDDRDPARASVLWREGLALARKTGDAVRIGTSLCGLSYAAVLQGDNERATALCEEALAYADKHEDAGDIIVRETLINLGLAALGRGDHGRAISSFERSLAMSQSAGRKPSLINALEGMASLAGAQGDAPRAARLWGAAEAGREATSIALPPGDRALHEPYLASARSRLGVATWEEALSKGRAMSLDEAAEYALAEDEPDTSTSSMSQALPNDEPVSSLTRREREVATLVARGCTNRQVANELSISERTAGNHVAKVLKKLGLASRVQIASWVTERRSLAADQE